MENPQRSDDLQLMNKPPRIFSGIIYPMRAASSFQIELKSRLVIELFLEKHRMSDQTDGLYGDLRDRIIFLDVWAALNF